MTRSSARILLLIVLASEAIAFSLNSLRSRNSHHLASRHEESESSSYETGLSRRDIFSKVLPCAFVATSMILQPQPSLAKDELFKKNPLTNSLLEKIRILEQAEADDIKYGGELAPGSPKGREGYAKLLVPILDVQSDLDQVQELVRDKTNRMSSLAKADTILSKPQYQKIQFKKTCNAFADNIYYSDPDRANAYLGGGAVPKNEQSIAYLLRNDVLTNIENLQAEVTYLIKEGKAGNELEVDDLYMYAKECSDGMLKYLELVPPGEIKIAKDFISSRV
jgi:hypothetical protein